MFQGLTEETYRFFWEIAFNNDRVFFEANRARYQENVAKPLKELTLLLTPAALEIDPDFNVRPASVISRIRRDTRYTRDKSMYRDHAWLSFRHPGKMLSESFVIYAEFEREAYGYGMGMYESNPALMQEFRARMLAKPHRFLELVTDKPFAERFTPRGDLFKRPRFQDAPEELRPYLNRKGLSFCFSSPQVSRTMRPEIVDEITEAFLIIKPVYRFLTGLD